MSNLQTDTTFYTCPMHRSVRQPNPGPCPVCGMTLLPEGTRFALFKHMASQPVHLAVMAAAMLAVMAMVIMVVG